MKWRSIFQAEDRKRLSRALRQAQDARSYQRILGVLLVAQGIPLQEVAAILQRHHHSVSRWINRYLAQCQTKALEDAPRPGRPVSTGTLTASKLRRELKRKPLRAGYPRTSWTVDLLACHLSQKYHSSFLPRTLRRRLKQWRIRWKRPRYRYSRRAIHLPQKKGLLSVA